jgi:L-alanine-DL-glutamate epimerase-like enolase superfamily enzyme
MSQSTLERIELDLLRVPLKSPYKLVFGNVEAFDTLLVTVTFADGRSGVGEATILTGYTEETLDQCWQAARAIGSEMPGVAAGDVNGRLFPWLPENPFTVTAFATAVEMTAGHATLSPAAASLPLLAILNETEPAALEAELERLLAAGYSTIKVKVGWNVDDDLRRVRHIQQAVHGRAAIRVDANQGYSKEDGSTFARKLDPAGIELFEQACAAGDWDAALAVKRVATVPIMLDESIYTMADVEKAAALGAADIIKLKLMKLGGIDQLDRALTRVRALGLGAVLGNGVATEIGCWMEACIGSKLLTTAGEMNGFLKQRHGLLTNPLRVERGSIQLNPASMPRLDPAAVAAARVAREEFRVPAGARITAR